MRVPDMLTHSKINALHHSGRKGPDKHLDRDQLYLVILPSNIKSWRLRYRINGREDTFVIGRYPTVTLKEARQAANQAQILIN